MRKILITTTDSLQGWEIDEYLKPVFASVVIGTNILSDISASFSDFFGGRSGSYEKKLQFVKDNAIQILTSKATELGANCLLGLKVDMDEISGKGTQMFMITAYATAVVANNLTSAKEPHSQTEVDKGTVGDKAMLIKLLRDIEDPKYILTTTGIQLAAENRAIEFKDVFFDKLIKYLKGSYQDAEAVGRIVKVFIEYFSNIDPITSKDVFYSGLGTEQDSGGCIKLSDIIIEMDLIDYAYCIKLLDSERLTVRKLALKILMGDKPFYISDDISDLKKTVSEIEISFPERGVHSLKKGGFLSDERKIWTCECGKTNNLEDRYCNNCSNNIYGFKSEEVQPQAVIDSLNTKAEALHQLFMR
jgi:uncharacterized protein YbjQ (UPF0145 family)